MIQHNTPDEVWPTCQSLFCFQSVTLSSNPNRNVYPFPVDACASPGSCQALTLFYPLAFVHRVLVWNVLSPALPTANISDFSFQPLYLKEGLGWQDSSVGEEAFLTNLTSIPRTHAKVVGENWLHKAVRGIMMTSAHGPTCTHTHTHESTCIYTMHTHTCTHTHAHRHTIHFQTPVRLQWIDPIKQCQVPSKYHVTMSDVFI